MICYLSDVDVISVDLLVIVGVDRCGDTKAWGVDLDCQILVFIPMHLAQIMKREMG